MIVIKKVLFIIIFLIISPLENLIAQDFNFQKTEKLMLLKPDSALVVLKVLRSKYEREGNAFSTAICDQQIGIIFFNHGFYLQALSNYFKSNKVFREIKNKTYTARNLNLIGQAYVLNRLQIKALPNFLEALSLYKSLNDIDGIAQTYGFIGQIYEKKHDYAKAYHYQQLGLKEYEKIGNQSGIAKIYENIGSILEDKSDYQNALHYFKMAMQLNQKEHNRIAQTEILNNLGDINRKTGKYAVALKASKRALKIAEELEDKHQICSANMDISKTFKLMGLNDSAYYYLNIGNKNYRDLYKLEENRQLNLLNILFDVERKDYDIKKLEDTRFISRMINFSALIIFLLLIFLAWTVYSRQKIKNENERLEFESSRKAMELEMANQQLREENLKADLHHKSKELTSHILLIIQKNELLEGLNSKLSTIVKSDKRDQRKELKEVISQINYNTDQDKNWDDFRTIFENVHADFFNKLANYPSLSPADHHLLALLKMNLSSANIAIMIGISHDSLRTSKYRLRKKLNLVDGENLQQFIYEL